MIILNRVHSRTCCPIFNYRRIRCSKYCTGKPSTTNIDGFRWQGIKETVGIKPRISQGGPNDIHPFTLGLLPPIYLSFELPDGLRLIPSSLPSFRMLVPPRKRRNPNWREWAIEDSAAYSGIVVWGRTSSEPLDAYCRWNMFDEGEKELTIFIAGCARAAKGTGGMGKSRMQS